MKPKEIIEYISRELGSAWAPRSKNNSLWLEKKDGLKIYEIIFNTIRTHGGLTFNGVISCGIRFKEVEDLLNPIYKKIGINYEDRVIFYNSKLIEEIDSIRVENINDLDKLMPYIKEVVKTEIESFIEANKSLDEINSKVSCIPKNEISNYIYFPQIIKIVALKKIAKSEDYEDFFNWAYNLYKEVASQGGQSDIFYKILEEMKERF